MLPEQIGRDRAARLLPGSASVREFAFREFPREDYHWVVSLTRPLLPARAEGRGFWSRLRGIVPRTPRSETEADTAPEPVPA
jgi:hypothetical protein